MSISLNFVGGGVHEVAAMRRDGLLVAGHFDSPDAADTAIGALTDYCAVWSTLNPLACLPQGRILNPANLTRGYRAGAQHVERRVSLLFDMDPPRPKGAMSTEEEHEGALRQARERNGNPVTYQIFSCAATWMQIPGLTLTLKQHLMRPGATGGWTRVLGQTIGPIP